MKNPEKIPNASDLVIKAEAIMHHCLKEMLEVEYNTHLLEGAFAELKKHHVGSPLGKAHSAVIRCVSDSIIISLHAACFDKSKAKKKSAPLRKIMRGKKASFCDAVSLIDGQRKLTTAAANLVTKQRVLLGARWTKWKPYMRFMEDEVEKEIPFPTFPGEAPIQQRIRDQQLLQKNSVRAWRKIGDSASFKRFKSTRDNLKAHHSMDRVDVKLLSSFADVISLSKECTEAMSAVYHVHFGRRATCDTKAGKVAYAALSNQICKRCGRAS
jgi:hypothetical protein